MACMSERAQPEFKRIPTWMVSIGLVLGVVAAIQAYMSGVLDLATFAPAAVFIAADEVVQAVRRRS